MNLDWNSVYEKEKNISNNSIQSLLTKYQNQNDY